MYVCVLTYVSEKEKNGLMGNLDGMRVLKMQGVKGGPCNVGRQKSKTIFFLIRTPYTNGEVGMGTRSNSISFGGKIQLLIS